MEKWKVLVVDDEVEIADYIGNLVKETLNGEAEVQVLYSGTMARKRLEKIPADLLVTDVVMPRVNGLDLLKYVAGNHPDTEVVLLTAYESFDYIYQANKIKACSYVVKVESEELICNKVQEAIQRQRDKKIKEETIDYARKQIEEVKQIFSEKEAKRMLNYEENMQVDWQLIRNIREYIRDNIKECITVASVAEAFHYSPAYLSKLFKQLGNENLSNYIMRQKIKEAKKMLIETNDSVQTIARKLGYQSSQTFARAFNRELSMTPQEYRRTYARKRV